MPGLSYRIRGDQGEMAGFIKLERCLLSKSIFNNEKLLKVWIWCLLKATYKEYTEMIGRQEVVIQPGQFTTGRFKAGEELNMNSSTAWSYLKLLQKNQSIGIKSNNKFSVVTIVNWALYQLDKDNSDNKSDNKKTTDEQQMNTNKNIKNDKKDKKVKKVILPKKTFGEKVHLSDEQYGKLVEKNGEQETKQMIDILDNWYLTKGKPPNDSDYHTMVGVGWVLKRFKEDQQKHGGSKDPVSKTPADKYDKFYL